MLTVLLYKFFYARVSLMPGLACLVVLTDCLKCLQAVVLARCLQDAQEFFLLMMNTIHENDQTTAVRETEEVARRHHVRAGLADLLRPPLHPASRKTLALGLVGGLVSSGAAMRNPFDGQQACSYQCRACHAKYVGCLLMITKAVFLALSKRTGAAARESLRRDCSGELTSPALCSALAAAPALFAHSIVAVSKICSFIPYSFLLSSTNTT